MGSFLWFIGVILICYGVVELFLGRPDKRKKKKWLLHNFGEQGMNNWLVNEFLLETMSRFSNAFTQWNLNYRPTSGYHHKQYTKECQAYDQCVAMYGENCFKQVHIEPDGSIRGLVLSVSCMGYVGTSNEVDTPWYPGYGARRTVPNGADWLAAGFRTPFMFNGTLIDPVALYLSEGGTFETC